MKSARVLPFGFGLGLFTSFVFAQAPASPPAAAPVEKAKTCFQCKGTGKVKCTMSSCMTGQANCPSPCLKLTDAGWTRMTVAGHPPTDLWRVFRGKKGSVWWNQNHVGEIVTIQNGEPVNQGKCPKCGGTTKIKCSVCKGTGEVGCTLCEGRKVVPESWTTFDNPKLKSRPTHFKLKDGSEIVGRKTMMTGSHVTIKTEKDSVTIPAADIVSEETPRAQK